MNPQEHPNPDEANQIRTYKTRWLVLASESSLSLILGSSIWYSSILDIYQQHLHISLNEYNWQTQIDKVACIVSVLASMVYIDRFGLRNTAYLLVLLIIAMRYLQVVAFTRLEPDFSASGSSNSSSSIALHRVASQFNEPKASLSWAPNWLTTNQFATSCLGLVFQGLINGIDSCMMTKIARDWFPERQTALVVSISWLVYMIGYTICILTPLLITRVADIERINYWFLGTGLYAIIILLAGNTRNLPEKPPSEAAIESRMSCGRSRLRPIFQFLISGQLMLLIGTLSFWFATQDMAVIFLEPILKIQGYGNEFSGILIGGNCILSIILIVPGSRLADYVQPNRRVALAKIIGLLHSLAYLLITIGCIYEYSAGLIVISGWVAMSLTHAFGLPIFYRVAFDSTLGLIPENNIGGLIYLLQMFMSFALSALGPILRQYVIGYERNLYTFYVVQQAIRFLVFGSFALLFRQPDRQALRDRFNSFRADNEPLLLVPSAPPINLAPPVRMKRKDLVPYQYQNPSLS